MNSVLCRRGLVLSCYLLCAVIRLSFSYAFCSLHDFKHLTILNDKEKNESVLYYQQVCMYKWPQGESGNLDIVSPEIRRRLRLSQDQGPRYHGILVGRRHIVLSFRLTEPMGMITGACTWSVNAHM